MGAGAGTTGFSLSLPLSDTWGPFDPERDVQADACCWQTGRRSLVWPTALEDTEGVDVIVDGEVVMSTSARECSNAPIDFHELVGAHGHHLFAVFDDPDAGEEAVEALRFEGFDDGKDIWVFCGEEGSKRLDRSGWAHGFWGRIFRMTQFAMSSDFEYLRCLDEALHRGHVVIAVRVKDEGVADEVARLLRMHAAHSIAYCSHWDFVPVVAA